MENHGSSNQNPNPTDGIDHSGSNPSNKKSFESCSISTTISTNNRVLNSIFSSSTNGGSDADGEDEDFLYWSSATDPDANPPLLSPTTLARGRRGDLKRKFSHRHLTASKSSLKRSSYGSFNQKESSSLAPPTPLSANLPEPVLSFSSASLSYSRSADYDAEEATEQTGLLNDRRRQRTDAGEQKICQRKRHLFIILGCVLFVFTAIAGIVLVAFTFQPLQFITATDIQVITRSVNMFEVGLVIEGFNPNIVSISLNETDLDVFASRGINTNFDSFVMDSRVIDPTIGSIRRLVRPAQELLGHVRSFNSSISFPPLSSSNLQCRISIVDPSNTLGRFIYMTFPHTILIRGEIGYSSLLDFTKSFIPVCIYQQLLSETNVTTYSCI
jgi:hypothetical protein